jgi:membrane dipeptidase
VELHEEALVFDAHIHMINHQLYLGGDIGDRASNGQVDLPRLRDGGVDDKRSRSYSPLFTITAPSH